jgi:hypothetical protein
MDDNKMCVIDERQLEMKKWAKQKITCRQNHFRKLVPPLTPMLVHGIQLLQYRLSTSFPLYLVKHVKIWLSFLHARVHVEHDLVPLVIHDICALGAPTTLPFH